MAQVERVERLAHTQAGPVLTPRLEPVAAAVGAVPGLVLLEIVGAEKLGA
jgi:hypothetical protein